MKIVGASELRKHLFLLRLRNIKYGRELHTAFTPKEIECFAKIHFSKSTCLCQSQNFRFSHLRS